MGRRVGTNASETMSGWDRDDDVILGLGGDDTLYGHGGDDSIDGGLGADRLYGGVGIDTAVYAESSEGVFVSLISGQGFLGEAQGDRLYGIENLSGSRHADTLIGDAGENTLSGGDGNDMLKGGGGADTLNGGFGIDTASYTDSNEGVVVLLELDHASGGHAHEDELNSIENLTGSAYDDHLWGTDGGANTLRGGRGNDSLKGFGGADTLYGGEGADTLHGGTGEDVLFGEAGADTFVFSSREECGLHRLSADQVADFSEAQGDRIDLSGIDANATIAGNQAFTWIGNQNDFVPALGAGQLRYNSGYVEGDTNGDMIADFHVWVSGGTELHDYAFVL